ncbi:hypothetical protein ABZ725_28510 [Streptomyces sp. NPDC006872]|uniref:hypothetical protein n=1 Tax=Streptomyces sp. NPDC006872 TaxID=3155720 RepID=UPI0033EF1473
MTAATVAAAIKDACFDARPDSHLEHFADDERGRAELAKRERIAQLLATVALSTVTTRTPTTSSSSRRSSPPKPHGTPWPAVTRRAVASRLPDNDLGIRGPGPVEDRLRYAL